MRHFQLVVFILFTFVCLIAKADEVSCRDPNAPDGLSGTWVTRFNVTDTLYGPMVRIYFLGYKAPGQAAPQEYFPHLGNSGESLTSR